MKAKLVVSIIGLAFAPFAFADEHDHKKHDEKEKHDDHAGHDHNHKQGPNHGRLIKDVEPHLEFLVMKDGKVQLTFVDDHNKVVASPDAKITMICGERANPTKVTFKKTEKGFVSNEKLPEGKNIPTILRVQPTKDAKNKTIRFNLNLEDCPDCEFLEYACTCDHGDDHEGHDHDDH